MHHTHQGARNITGNITGEIKYNNSLETQRHT